MTRLKRCAWAGDDPLMRRYHDAEWGVPVHNDRRLFEMLTLEGAQAGLSWRTILRRRTTYREAFDRFDISRVARFTASDQNSLLRNPGVIRSRPKIGSAVGNARAILAIQKEFGSFDAYIWQFAPTKPGRGRRREHDVPARTAESAAMSRDLRRRGFTFVGPTICYAFMQAVGMVNDHVTSCHRCRALASKT